jgi:hypothetical protein
MVQPDRPQMTIRRMRFACRVIKATCPHSEYALLIASAGASDFANAPRYYIYAYISSHVPLSPMILFAKYLKMLALTLSQTCFLHQYSEKPRDLEKKISSRATPVQWYILRRV